MFRTQAEFDAYLAEIKGIEAPDLCESVMFQWAGKDKPERHRVCGWYRAIPDTKPETMDHVGELIWEIKASERAERQAKGRVLIVACKREEATHVEITAVGSGIVRIDRIQRTNQLVDWEPEFIAKYRETWGQLLERRSWGLTEVSAR